MNCNKTIETNVTEETFIQEIEKAKECIAKVLNIDIKNIDEVAYVRFASVYKAFDSVEAFRDEISKM